MNTQDTRLDVNDFVTRLNGAIRGNPLAAGLVGLGVAWMLLGNSRVSALGGTVPRAVKGAARSVASAASSAGSAVGSGISAAGHKVGEAARHARDSLSHGLHATGDAARRTYDAERSTLAEAKDAMSHAVEQSEDAVRHSVQSTAAWGSSLKQQWSENLARQPFLIGALGLAAGAGLAMACRSTRIEGELLGDAASAAKQRLQGLASQASEIVGAKAREVLGAVKSEASERGLAPDAAKEAFKGIAESAKTVAGNARDAVANRFSSRS